jgi:hypothetical protein
VSPGVYLPLATPHLHRRLLWALRFRDVFTGATVESPLEVSVPALELRAVRGLSDHTWRLQHPADRPPAPGPPAAVPVVVTDPSGGYVAHEPISVPRQHPGVLHPPPILRDDFLLEFPLWPTRSARLPLVETVVVGRLLGPGGAPLAGRRVAMAPAPAVPPAAPRAVTDSAGEFVIRLPALHRVDGARTAELAVAVSHLGADVPIAAVSPPGGAPGLAEIPLGSHSLVTVTTA